MKLVRVLLYDGPAERIKDVLDRGILADGVTLFGDLSITSITPDGPVEEHAWYRGVADFRIVHESLAELVERRAEQLPKRRNTDPLPEPTERNGRPLLSNANGSMMLPEDHAEDYG